MGTKTRALYLSKSEQGDFFKTKNSSCIKKDNIIKSLVKRHKRGKMRTTQYFQAIVSSNW